MGKPLSYLLAATCVLSAGSCQSSDPLCWRNSSGSFAIKTSNYILVGSLCFLFRSVCPACAWNLSFASELFLSNAIPSQDSGLCSNFTILNRSLVILVALSVFSFWSSMLFGSVFYRSCCMLVDYSHSGLCLASNTLSPSWSYTPFAGLRFASWGRSPHSFRHYNPHLDRIYLRCLWMVSEYWNWTFDSGFSATDNEFEVLEDQRPSLLLFIHRQSCLSSWWNSMHVSLVLRRQMVKNCYYS